MPGIETGMDPRYVTPQKSQRPGGGEEEGGAEGIPRLEPEAARYGVGKPIRVTIWAKISNDPSPEGSKPPGNAG